MTSVQQLKCLSCAIQYDMVYSPQPFPLTLVANMWEQVHKTLCAHFMVVTKILLNKRDISIVQLDLNAYLILPLEAGSMCCNTMNNVCFIYIIRISIELIVL